jgi:hypothetical protein
MQNYIIGKITMRKSKNIRVPAIKKIATGLELISDFTLNSDNYDMKFLMS